MCIGNTARERKNGILYDEKRGRNLTVRTFQRNRVLLEELLSEENTSSQKGGGLGLQQESVLISVYLCIRLCVAEDEEGGKNVNP